jgi:hypothetical protein
VFLAEFSLPKCEQEALILAKKFDRSASKTSVKNDQIFLGQGRNVIYRTNSKIVQKTLKKIQSSTLYKCEMKTIIKIQLETD